MTKSKPDKVTREITAPTTDGGIYARRALVGPISKDLEDKLLEAHNVIGNSPDRLEAQLDLAASQAATVILAVAREESQPDNVTREPSRRYLNLDLGSGRKLYSLPDDWTDEVNDALQVIRLVRKLRRMCRPNSPVAGALLDAYLLGHLSERMHVRPHELDARRGKIIKRAAAAGGRATKSLDDSGAANAKAERDRLIVAGHSKLAAANLVAEQFGVSYKTIERLK